MRGSRRASPRFEPGDFAGRPIGVALLSFAHFHQHHWARTFLADPRVQIVGFWDDSDRRSLHVSQEYGIRRFHELDELLDSDGLAAVAICSETEHHRSLVESCAARGLHILCEKPVARDLEEAREMRRVVRATRIVYFQSSPQRLVPANRRMRGLIREGAIGRVTHVRKRHGHHFGLENLGEEMPWIIDPFASGGGAFIDEGVHETDALRCLLGDPLSVIAMMSPPDRYPVESHGSAIYRFSGGATAVLEAGWNWIAGGPTTEVYGDEGTLIESLTDRASNSPGQFWPHLAVFRKDEGVWRDSGERFDFEKIHSLAPEAFVDALEGGMEPASTIDDGIKALEMIVGAYRSAHIGREVEFPL